MTISEINEDNADQVLAEENMLLMDGDGQLKKTGMAPCQYPAGQIPLHVSYKSGQGAGRASMCRHPAVSDLAF
jgi:hypothetical protein